MELLIMKRKLENLEILRNNCVNSVFFEKILGEILFTMYFPYFLRKDVK